MMGHGISGLLISAAAGYWVLAQSSGQKGRVKTLGQWLGLLIIVVGIAGAACKAYCFVAGDKCMISPAGKACSFGGRMGAPAPAQQ